VIDGLAFGLNTIALCSISHVVAPKDEIGHVELGLVN